MNPEDEGSRSGGEATTSSAGTTITTSAVAAAAAAAGIHIKREPVDETDIKDFAETTMNELLGWYGYGKVDSRDTQGLNLHRFTATGSPNPQDEDGEGMPGGGGGGNGRPDAPSPNNSSNEATGNNGTSTKPPDPVNLPPGYIVCAWCQKVGMKLFTLKTATGQKAFCSELCFTQCRRASFKKNKVCDWCKHIRHTVNYVDFQDGEQQLQFCSNKCLNQYKMNIFCRETQAHLQMHPHLQDAAKLGGPSGSVSSGTSGGSVTLITPELWLRDCHGTTHESSSSTGINGHDGKGGGGGGDATMSPQRSVEEEDEPFSSVTVGTSEDSHPHRHSRKSLASSSSSITISGIKERSKFSRHNSRFRDKHKRYRGFHKMRSSAPTSSAAATRALKVGVIDAPNVVATTAVTSNSSLTSPKTSSGQPSPNVPGSTPTHQQVIGSSPLSSSSGTATISPHPPSLPPQLLAAAVAAAAAANNQQHPHPGMLPPELTRPPFGPPPMGPHYPFLGQPHADMLLRLPHGGVRAPGGNGGQPPPPPPPFLFPPGFGFPFGLQGPPPPPPPGSGSGSSQPNLGGQPPPPTHNPLINPLLSSLLPPVAVMVPYPVVIPIPIPIPIPLPFPVPTPEFFKKFGTKDEGTKVPSPPSSTTLSTVRGPNPLSSFTSAMAAVTSSGATVAARDSLQSSRTAGKGSTNLSRLSRHLHANSVANVSGTSSAKRVDSVITRLVAPKLMTQVPTVARGLTSFDTTQALSLASASLTTSSSTTTPALTSSAMASSLHESSSDQSNGLDDSSDISDFPESDAFDLEGAESEDSRLSEGALRLDSERSRTFCPVLSAPSQSSLPLLGDSVALRTSPPSTSASTTPTSLAAAFPALPSRERREEREAERRDVSRVENSIPRETTLDTTSVEPEMKRKCLRARLTAK